MLSGGVMTGSTGMSPEGKPFPAMHPLRHLLRHTQSCVPQISYIFLIYVFHFMIFNAFSQIDLARVSLLRHGPFS